MKTITLVVTLTFDTDISDDREIQEVVHNVINAIYHEAEEVGISPVDSDSRLTKIVIQEPFRHFESEQEL